MSNYIGGYTTPSLAGSSGGGGDEQILGGKGADLTAAAQMDVGNDGNYFVVNGITTIEHLSTEGWTAGSIIYLQFSNAPVVADSVPAAPDGYAAIELSGDDDFQASSDDVLTLAYDGATWREIARTDI